MYFSQQQPVFLCDLIIQALQWDHKFLSSRTKKWLIPENNKILRMLLYTKEETSINNILYRVLKFFHHSWLLAVISSISSPQSYLTSKTERYMKNLKFVYSGHKGDLKLQSTQQSKKWRGKQFVYKPRAFFKKEKSITPWNKEIKLWENQDKK